MCVLDNASVVHPLPLTLEALLSESIILDIINGMKLVPKPRERERTISNVPLRGEKKIRPCSFADVGVVKLTTGGEFELEAGPVCPVIVQTAPQDGGTYHLELQINQRPQIDHKYTEEIHGCVLHDSS